MKKEKKMYPLNARGLTGYTMATVAPNFVAMSMSMLMVFFTDYSGIDTALGKPGYAVTFGTIFMLITRIIDGVDDPIQGWLIDSSKESKFGKYRRFMNLGTVILAIGGIMLYAMPDAVKSNTITLWMWAIVGYLFYDMGCAMSNLTSSLMQKETTNPNVRAKLTVCMRLAAVFAAMPAMFYVSIVTVLGKDGDLGKTATLVAVVLIIIFCSITWAGVALLKEPYRKNQEKADAKRISFKEIGVILKTRIMWVNNLGFFIGNLPYGLSTAVMLYYIRWYFCADLSTGEVDLVKFAALAGLYTVVSLLPNFIAPFLVPLAMRVFKTVDKATRVCYLLIALGYGLIFIFNITGIMQVCPYLLFVLFFLIMLPSGLGAQFTVLINAECADLVEYESGRNMTALTSSIYGVVNRVGTAISAAIPGAMLALIGYSVDSATGNYIGDLADLPAVVDGLSVLISIVPAVLALLAAAVYKFGYNVTPEFREKVAEELQKRHAE